MSDGHLCVRNMTFLDKGPYSFSVEKGECVGLAGRSGIGKTQLFRAITDLIPAGGEVLLEGIPSSSFTPAKWRSKVTMVPADSSWWYDRAGDHFPVSDRIPFIQESCRFLGLDPHVLDWQVRRLSTGERQRLALVRAIQNRPTVLLLDEPSSGLDAYHTELMEKFIKDYLLLHKPAIVWVSHDPEQITRVAGRKLWMEQHKLSERP
ncbi:MAG: ATP-binding cassette domain-containing protein [Desulforhopalus sp.]